MATGTLRKKSKTQQQAAVPKKKSSKPASGATATSRPLTPSKATAYIGWSTFREEGGDVLSNIVEIGREQAVGTGSKNLQMRLRPADKYPDEAAKVRPEHVLRLQVIKENIHQVRALIAQGVPFMFLSKGQARILADRHPSYEAGMVDAYTKSVRTAARAAGRRDYAKVILLLAKALGKEMSKKQPKQSKRDPQPTSPIRVPHGDNITFHSPNVLAAAVNLVKLADERGQDPEKFARHWLAQRGANAEVERRTGATANHLEGSYGD